MNTQESQDNTKSGDFNERNHDYTEIPDIAPTANGIVKDKEKESLIKKPSEYEMAMRCPRYVNIEDADDSTTTML